MSWQAIARKDFRDARRSYWLWGLSALFILLVAGVAALLAYASDLFGVEALTSSTLLTFLNGSVITWIVPLIAIVMAYSAIVGERESGSLRLLLAPPHSRRDVVVGKFLGRTAAVVVPVLVGFLLPAIVFAIFVEFEAIKYVGFTVLSSIVAVVFVALAVGVSASVAAERIALLALLAVYLVFIVVWGSIQIPLRFAIGLGGYPDSLQWIPVEPQTLLDILRVVNPTGAFKILTNNFLNDTLFAANAEGVDPQLHSAALLMLALWILVPLAIGIVRFENADL
jgi:ABC-2 type transport system permease protein